MASPVLLKLAEEILDQVSGLIEFSVIGALCFSVAFGWDHSAFAISLELVNDPFMRIEDFVGNQGICRFESTEPQRLADHELAPELRVKPMGGCPAHQPWHESSDSIPPLLRPIALIALFYELQCCADEHTQGYCVFCCPPRSLKSWTTSPRHLV